MSRKKGNSLKDNEFTKDWKLEDIYDIDEESAGKNWRRKYPSLLAGDGGPGEKFLIRCIGVVVAAVISIVGCLVVARKDDGNMAATTVIAQEETRMMTNQYLSSMNDVKNGVISIDDEKVGDISDRVAGLITDDMVKSAESGDTDALLTQIETGVADILKDDPEFTANLSDDDMSHIVNSVTAIVKSEIADSVENATSNIHITASTTKHISDVQESANTSADQLVSLNGRITDTNSAIDALAKKVDAFVNSQDSVNRQIDGKIAEVNSKAEKGLSGNNGTDGAGGTDGKNGSDGSDFSDSALKDEIRNLEDRLAQMESDYETLSGQYASAKKSIAALEIAASGYADTSDVVAVSDSLADMNQTMQLQLSQIMNQIAVLESAAESSQGSAQTDVSSADYDELKSKVSSLQKQLQDASNTVVQLMNMPEGTDLSTALGEYMTSVKDTNAGLRSEYENFRNKIESDERRYDSMYEDYNELLLSYRDATGSLLTLSQILATKGDKKDLDELKSYAYELYKTVVLNHNTVMKELYGDSWAEIPLEPSNNGATGNNSSNNNNSSSDNGGNASSNDSGNTNGNGSASSGSGTGASNSGSKSIREEIGDIHEDISEETSEREQEDQAIRDDLSTETDERKEEDQAIRDDLSTETDERKEEDQAIRDDLSTETDERKEEDQAIRDDLSAETDERKQEDQAIRDGLSTETEDRKQDVKDIRAEMKKEADKTAEDIKSMYEQIWGITPGETIAGTDNLQLLKELDEKINSASESLAQLQGMSPSEGGDGNTAQISSSSGTLSQAVSNVISAYQTADNAIIDALKDESANRKTTDESLQNQIDTLGKVVSDNQGATTSDTLAIKKAIAPYVKEMDEHGAIPAMSYIYYDGKGLEGAGFYYVDSNVGANEDITGKVHRTSVAEAIKQSNSNVGELIKLLQQNEEFAARYKLK